MDGSDFDALVRSFATGHTRNTRRRLLGLLTALPLGGVLSTVSGGEVAAERPLDRLRQRTEQRNRKQRNRRRLNKKQNNDNNNSNNNTGGGGGGGLGAPGPCLATGAICDQDSDCCTANCFNFVCAVLVTACTDGQNTRPCRPPAKGCAGDQCCHGALSCDDGCCQGLANQCNPEGDCCTPNCGGRQCGDDGCGNGETCGTCPTGQPCTATTGQCAPCIAKGGACNGGGGCCSGICCQGTCCGSGQDCLGNGTCATPCSANCPICGSFGTMVCFNDASNPQASYCAGNSLGIQCPGGDSDCERGQFCRADVQGAVCAAAC